MSTHDDLKEAIVIAAIGWHHTYSHDERDSLAAGQARQLLSDAVGAFNRHELTLKPCSEWSCPKPHRIEPAPMDSAYIEHRYHHPEQDA